jgi:hypothetical protein
MLASLHPILTDDRKDLTGGIDLQPAGRNALSARSHFTRLLGSGAGSLL